MERVIRHLELRYELNNAYFQITIDSFPSILFDQLAGDLK